MVSVSDGCLQGIDSCLEPLIDQTQQSPGVETREDEGRKESKGRNVKGDRQLTRPRREGGGNASKGKEVRMVKSG